MASVPYNVDFLFTSLQLEQCNTYTGHVTKNQVDTRTIRIARSQAIPDYTCAHVYHAQAFIWDLALIGFAA